MISILISSDFLKMDSLVEDCITYCHENLTHIVSTPCNMNCVNERLTDRIAQRFKHKELEDVKGNEEFYRNCVHVHSLISVCIRKLCVLLSQKDVTVLGLLAACKLCISFVL